MKTNKLRFVMVFALILGFVMPMTAFAETVRSCSITIDANKHDPYNEVDATGDCKGYIRGYYEPHSKSFIVIGSYTGVVYGGQKIEFHLPAGKAVLSVNVINKKQPDPKPEPKPQPTPTPKPEPKPEPKPTPTPDPKPSQPSTPPKTNTPTPTAPKTSTPKTSTPKSKQSTTQKPSTNSTQKKQSETKTPTAKTAKEVSKWTVNDLKKQDVKVEQKNGKIFASVNGVAKEISKEEAEELGYKVEEIEEVEQLASEKEEVIEENTENTKDIEEKKETSEKKKSFVPYLLGSLGLGVPTLGALGYAYFRRKG